ncbi:MAG: type II toxin-antitoxin system VapC family toxin [Acidimicrobiia bacterium]
MTVGILDTCVVIALGQVDPDDLPDEQAITTVTLGELTVGPLIAADVSERARRQARLQAVEHHFADAMLPYDQAAARAFGMVMAGAIERGRRSRARVSDFQIAAIAIANQLPLFTIDVDDFAGIAGLDLRPVRAPGSGRP